jgi:hypothetical protein
MSLLRPRPPDASVAVELGEVVAEKPLAAISGRFLLRPVPVTEHQAGIAAMDGVEADLAGRQRIGPVLDQEDCDAAALGMSEIST